MQCYVVVFCIIIVIKIKCMNECSINKSRMKKIEECIRYSFDMNIGLFQVYGIKRPWHCRSMFILCVCSVLNNENLWKTSYSLSLDVWNNNSMDAKINFLKGKCQKVLFMNLQIVNIWKVPNRRCLGSTFIFYSLQR